MPKVVPNTIEFLAPHRTKNVAVENGRAENVHHGSIKKQQKKESKKSPFIMRLTWIYKIFFQPPWRVSGAIFIPPSLDEKTAVKIQKDHNSTRQHKSYCHDFLEPEEL